MIDENFFKRLNTLLSRVPGSLRSGCRTPKHNAVVGGAKRSWHIGTLERPARAADILYDSKEEAEQAAAIAVELGFSGIEVHDDGISIHVDTGDRAIPWHVREQVDGTFQPLVITKEV